VYRAFFSESCTQSERIWVQSRSWPCFFFSYWFHLTSHGFPNLETDYIFKTWKTTSEPKPKKILNLAWNTQF
jgi:hypothetical protein